MLKMYHSIPLVAIHVNIQIFKNTICCNSKKLWFMIFDCSKSLMTVSVLVGVFTLKFLDSYFLTFSTDHVL